MKLRGKGAPKKKRSKDGELMVVYKALTVAKIENAESKKILGKRKKPVAPKVP